MAADSSSDPPSTEAVNGKEQMEKIKESPIGKTCHQCRQKAKGPMASCKGYRRNKPCPLSYCHRCLMNRYGEKLEDLENMDEWKCPKCNDVCNCSVCMQCKGFKPTGMLLREAKENGFSSASQLLDAKGPENFDGSRRKVPRIGSVDNQQKESSSDEIGEESMEGNDGRLESHDDAVNGNINGPSELDEKQKIEMPPGTLLTTMQGIELSVEEAGHALEFFEFTHGFSEVLNLKKGQAEAVVKDIINGRKGSCSKYSSVAQFHIQMLQLLEEDMKKESPACSPTETDVDFPWFKALGRYVVNSEIMAKEFPLHCFDGGNEGYNELTTSQKLKLLNFLCNEALSTEKLRSWIDDQKFKSRIIAGEAQGKLNLAKEKAKDLKEKLQVAMLKGPVAETDAPMSESDHAAIVSEIQNQAAQAHKEVLDAKDALPKRNKRFDAFRTDPLLLDADGRVFWRLNCYSEEPHVLLQEMGAYGPEVTTDKWFIYEADKIKEIQEYISSLSKRRRRPRKIVQVIASMEAAETSSAEDPSEVENADTAS